MTFDDAFDQMPVVAILRGVTPREVEATADALYSAGIRIVEVPMNSPEPLKSISIVAQRFAGRLLVGAGTVVRPEWVDEIRVAGGSLIVAPNTDPAVIKRALENGLEPMPGFATATEAFAGRRAGARYLKLFPASGLGTSTLNALKAVLPGDSPVIAVGGIAPATVESWWDVGAKGLGIGSEIFRPGQSPDQTFQLSTGFVSIIRNLQRASTLSAAPKLTDGFRDLI
jgi:2-dehydro-3-deoxyphosphogalactonate aldolase